MGMLTRKRTPEGRHLGAPATVGDSLIPTGITLISHAERAEAEAFWHRWRPPLIRTVLPLLDDLRAHEPSWKSAVLLAPAAVPLLHVGTNAEEAAHVATTVATLWRNLDPVRSPNTRISSARDTATATDTGIVPESAAEKDSMPARADLLTTSCGDRHGVTASLTSPATGDMLLWISAHNTHLGHVIRQTRHTASRLAELIHNLQPPQD